MGELWYEQVREQAVIELMELLRDSGFSYGAVADLLNRKLVRTKKKRCKVAGNDNPQHSDGEELNLTDEQRAAIDRLTEILSDLPLGRRRAFERFLKGMTHGEEGGKSENVSQRNRPSRDNVAGCQSDDEGCNHSRRLRTAESRVRSVALNAGISQPQLHRFMTGERDLLLEAADKVAKSLGLELRKIDD